MKERDWVPFHSRLARGAKKSIPRGVRFVLLELSLEARPTHGVLEFPPEWDTLTAVHDRIGGDRKEIRKALTIFQIPDATGAQVIQIERDETQHRLKICKWEDWAGPKSDAERAQTYRRTKDLGIHSRDASKALVTPTVQDSTEQERERTAARAPEAGSTVVKLDSYRPPPPSDPEPPEAIESEDPAQLENGYALALRVWQELWQAKYRRRYEQVGGRLFGEGSEDRVLQRVGEKAVIRGKGAERYLRHKISAYLRDHGNRGWLDEHCHPLRTLERDWVAYGEPKAPGRMVPRELPDPAEQMPTKEQAAKNLERAKLLAGGVGRGGT